MRKVLVYGNTNISAPFLYKKCETQNIVNVFLQKLDFLTKLEDRGNDEYYNCLQISLMAKSQSDAPRFLEIHQNGNVTKYSEMNIILSKKYFPNVTFSDLKYLLLNETILRLELFHAGILVEKQNI